MSGNAIIGALRVVLGLDTAQFDDGLKSSQRKLNAAGGQFKKIGGDMTALGARMSLALTAPLVAMGIAAAGAAGNFEASMNRVQVATQATAKEMATLEAKALKIGKTTVFGANQAAGAMESLAKAGVSTRDILNGAADATVNLAAATGSKLDPAATAISDTLSQFHMSAAALPQVVDQITGAVNESKLSFEDYQLGMGMAGGAAGAAGVEFTDFNAVLAGTSAMFASGSDAGTSFKTFLGFLTPKSKEAAAAITDLKLKFYEADGSLKSMTDIAGQLKEKLGGLSDEARTKVLHDIFGTDAMRTAIGLMNLGADGLDKIKAKIAETDAAAQAAKLMEGLNGQLNKLKNAFEGLAIAIGHSGFLEALTGAVQAIAGVVEGLAEAHPLILGVGVAIAALVAIVGPVILLMGAFATSIGSIISLAATFTPVMLAMGGSMLRVAGQATLAGAAMRAVGVSMSFMQAAALPLLGVFGLLIAALMGWNAETVRTERALKDLEDRAETTAKVLAETAEWGRAAGDGTKALGDAAGNSLDNVASLTGEVHKLADANYRLAASYKDAQLAKLTAALSDANDTRAKAVKERNRAQTKGAMFAGVGAIGIPGAGSSPIGPTGNTFNVNGDQGADFKRAARVVAESDKQIGEISDRIDTLVSTPLSDPRFQPPKAGGGGGSLPPADAGGGRKAGGKTAAELALQREELELQARLEAARARNDVAAVQDLEKKLDLRQRIAAYEDAGLKKGEAEIAAARDVTAIEAAKADARRRALADREDEVSLAVAEELGQSKVVDLLERKAEKARLITWYQEQGLDLAAATARAESDLLRIDQARLKTRADLVKEMAEEHAITLAKARGDSDAEIRALERAAELRRRSQQYERDLQLSPADAAAQAGLELDQEEQARQQGLWRDTIKGAFKAAMDGDLAGFAENWLKGWAAKGLETALNDIADTLMALFKNAFAQVNNGAGGSGDSGWVGGLVKFVGGLFTSGSTTSTATTSGSSLQGFSTGGSFKVGGSGQADSKVVSMRLTPGEMVDIRKPGNDAGPAGIGGLAVHVQPSPLFQVAVSRVAASASSGAARAAYAQSSADLARTQRSQGRKLGAG